MTKKLESQLANFKGFLATLGVAISAGGLALWTKSAIEGAALSTRLATRVGMTSEAFEKLGYAAKLSGMDQETLAHNLTKMDERLAEVAIEGAGPAADSLRKFGLSARALTQMGAEQAFMTLAGVLERIPNEMERIKVAKDIFGKSGEGMVGLALQGTDALKKMGLEAQQLGVAMSGVDNAKLAEANAAFIKIGEAVQGVANSIAVGLAPYITAISDQFIEWMKSGTKTGSYVAQAIDWVAVAISEVIDDVNLVGASFYGLRSIFNEVVSALLEGIDFLVQSLTKITNLIPGVKIEITDFFHAWSENMEKAATEDWAKMVELSSKNSLKSIRKLQDEIELGAQKRAEFAAGKQAAAAGIGTAVTPKIAETKFAGATEAGGAAGYSAVVQAKARQLDAMQGVIANATLATAQNTGRAVGILEKIAGIGKETVDGAQFRMQAAAK